MMKMTYRWLVALLVMSLWLPAVASAAEKEQEAPLTRGQFFDMITTQFGWTDSVGGTYIWSDVPEGFRYAPSVSALQARGLLSGYPDGTLQLDQLISARDAAGLLVRSVGLSNNQYDFLYGYASPVDLKEGLITEKQAQLLINRVNRSDAESMSLFSKAEQANQRVGDVAFTYTQSMDFKTEQQVESRLTIQYDLALDEESGYKMVSQVEASDEWMEHPYAQSLLWDLSEENYETYALDDSIYYRYYEEDQERWVRYDNWLSQDEYRSMVLDDTIEQLLGWYAYTYRYVGEQACADGQGQCQVVHFNWNPDYKGDISSLLDNTPFGWDLSYWLEEESMTYTPTLSGTIIFDAASGLVRTIKADLTLQVSGEEQWTGEIATHVNLSFMYDDVAPIVLPEEAEQAEYWGDDMWGKSDVGWYEEDYDWYDEAQ